MESVQVAVFGKLDMRCIFLAEQIRDDSFVQIHLQTSISLYMF